MNGYESIDVDGERLYTYDNATEHNGGPPDGYVQGSGHDPWFEQDRQFIEAVRAAVAEKQGGQLFAVGGGAAAAAGGQGVILNDYADGLRSLAPVLAGWHSARHGGTLVACEDVRAFAALQARPQPQQLDLAPASVSSSTN